MSVLARKHVPQELSVYQQLARWQGQRRPVATMTLSFLNQPDVKLRIWSYANDQQVVITEIRNHPTTWDVRTSALDQVIQSLMREHDDKSPSQLAIGLPVRATLPFPS